jgi:ATP-dependent RNA helicase DHX29
MAPKKKTKPTANPARGFATTSIASKPKPEREPEKVVPVEALPTKKQQQVQQSAKKDDAKNQTKPGTAAPANGTTAAKEVHQLSPEELEKQLEEGELQAFVDSHSEKVKKDAARQISKLKTDKRLNRSTAEELSIGKLLTPDHVEDILSGPFTELQNGSLAFETETTKALKSRYDHSDAFLAKIWTLSKCLQGIQIPAERIDDCLTFVIRKSWAGYDFVSSKDSIWGLEEALEWIALRAGETELQSYDDVNIRPRVKVDQTMTLDLSGAKLVEQAPEPVAVSEKGDDDEDDPDIIPAEDDGDDEDKPVAAADAESAVSDIDSDIEPDQLLAVYLRTKEKLYGRWPGSEKFSKKRKAGKAAPRAPTRIPPKGRDPKNQALEAKLSRIEGDMLFDQDQADEKWEAQKEELDRSNIRSQRLVDGERYCKTTTTLHFTH